MTSDDLTHERSLDVINQNVAKIEELSQRLVSAIANKRQYDSGLAAPGQDLFVKAAGAYWAEMISNPGKMIEHQAAYWGKTLQHFVEAQKALASGKLEVPEDNTPRDRRFSNPLWSTHPYFNFVKQQYFLNAEAVQSAVAQLDGLDDRDKHRVAYFARQIIDAFSPTNFLATNPDALEKAVETEGKSLVDGLENLVRDIEASDGEMLVTLADKDAFTVGKNIATTEGSVVFRNRMFELIQYTPTTETVHKTPLVIFPPWINKFYIMDLKPRNSLLKWIVDAGYTVFVVSWVNPDETYAETGIETYLEEGFLTAIEEVKAITDEPQVNAVGYCIAGTALSMTLAYLAKKQDKSVRSATFFTTVTDFSDQREFTPFLQDDFVDGIEREVAKKGYLDSFFMSRTFSYLRSNDLIYTPAIRSYMMGETPPAFDLLFWNGDSTNLPAKMIVEYLRELCQENSFAGKGIKLLGETLHIKDVAVPLCAIACEADHIANWEDSYRGIAMMGSRSKLFILSESGHIAGIINPPSKKKYGHYTNEKSGLTSEDWRKSAAYSEGSWWPRWAEWLGKRAGKQVPARHSVDPIMAAPGSFVLGEKPQLDVV